MQEGDRVRVTHAVLSDKSDAKYIGQVGTVVIVKPGIPSSVAVLLDGDTRWHAFAIRQLEKE